MSEKPPKIKVAVDPSVEQHAPNMLTPEEGQLLDERIAEATIPADEVIKDAETGEPIPDDVQSLLKDFGKHLKEVPVDTSVSESVEQPKEVSVVEKTPEYSEDDTKKEARIIFESFFFNTKDAEEKTQARFNTMREKLASLEVDDAERNRLAKKLDKFSEAIYALRHRTSGQISSAQRQHAERLIVPLMSAGIIEPKRQRALRNVDVQAPVAEVAPSAPAEPVAMPVEPNPEPVVVPEAKPAPVEPESFAQENAQLEAERKAYQKKQEAEATLKVSDEALQQQWAELEQRLKSSDDAQLKTLLEKARETQWNLSFVLGKRSKEAGAQRTKLKELITAIEAREEEMFHKPVASDEALAVVEKPSKVRGKKVSSKPVGPFNLPESLENKAKVVQPADMATRPTEKIKTGAVVPTPAVEPLPEPQFRIEERIEKTPDGIELSADEIGAEVKKLIGGLATVNSFNIVGVGNELRIDTELDHSLGGVFGLKATLKSDGKKLEIVEVDVRAGFVKRKIIESKVGDALPGLVPKIKDYLSNKYGKTVTALSIKEGKLNVQFPDKEKKVPVKIPIPPKVVRSVAPTPVVSSVAPSRPTHQAKETIQAMPSPYMAPEMYQAVVQSQPLAPEANPIASVSAPLDVNPSPLDKAKAKEALDALPPKERVSAFRLIAGIGHSAQIGKSKFLARLFSPQSLKGSETLEGLTPEQVARLSDAEKVALQERQEGRRSGVLKLQSRFMDRVLRGVSGKFSKDAEKAKQNRDRLHSKKGSIIGNTEPYLSLAQLGLLGRRVWNLSGFDPLRLMGSGFFLAGKGLETLKEAQLDSYQKIEANRETYEDAYAEAEQIQKDIAARMSQKEHETMEKGMKPDERGRTDRFRIDPKQYEKEYVTRMPKDLLNRLKKDGHSWLGLGEATARHGIIKTLKGLEQKVDEIDATTSLSPKQKSEAKEKLLGTWKTSYLKDVERLLDRDGKVDLMGYYLRSAEKITKGTAWAFTGEALAHLFLSYDNPLQAFVGKLADWKVGVHGDMGSFEPNAEQLQQMKGLKVAKRVGKILPDHHTIPPLEKISGDESSVAASHATESVLSGHLIESIPIGKRGPEGSIIDYFTKHEAVAKQFGWDGKSPLKTWAGNEAHKLWLEHAKTALESDVTKEQLSKLGYSQDLDGYAKMMTRIKGGGVAIDLEHKGISLDHADYLHAKVADATAATEKFHHGIGSVPDDVQYTNGTEHLQAVGSGSVPDDVQYAHEGIGDHEVVDRNLPHVETDAHEAVPDPGDHAPGESRWEQHIAERAEQAPVEQTPLMVESIDTSGMSLVEAVQARFEHDLGQVFNVDEQHSEWHQWRGFGAKRLLKLGAGEGSQAGRLQEYLKILEKESGTQPRGFWFPEKVQNYIQRALKVIEEKKRG